jgi:hypothetical protein
VATIRKLTIKEPDRVSAQGEVEASVMLIDHDGEAFVQIDSYGSKDRKFVGKRSQSLRLSKSAFDQLVTLGQKHFSKGQ